MRKILMICLILVIVMAIVVACSGGSKYQPPRYTVEGGGAVYEHCSNVCIGGLFSRYVRFTAENGSVIALYGEFTVIKETKNEQYEN